MSKPVPQKNGEIFVDQTTLILIRKNSSKVGYWWKQWPSANIKTRPLGERFVCPLWVTVAAMQIKGPV